MATVTTLTQLRAQAGRKRLINSEIDEIEGVVTRLLDNLAYTVAALVETGADLRRQIGKLRSDYVQLLVDIKFSTELLKCFTLASEAPVKLEALGYVRDRLFAEIPSGSFPTAIVHAAIMFCLSAESRIVSNIKFVSRDDVETMMARMKKAFDTAREKAADEHSNDGYEKLTYLAGALTNHLANTARPLPRMVKFTMSAPFPLLTVSHKLYYDASRWDELFAENKIIHPAFAPIQIRGLAR